MRLVPVEEKSATPSLRLVPVDPAPAAAPEPSLMTRMVDAWRAAFVPDVTSTGRKPTPGGVTMAGLDTQTGRAMQMGASQTLTDAAAGAVRLGGALASRVWDVGLAEAEAGDLTGPPVTGGTASVAEPWADAIAELSIEAPERLGVDPDFAKSLGGQIAAAMGQLPVFAAAGMVAPTATTLGMGTLGYEQATRDYRESVPEAERTPEEELGVGLVVAVPTAALERAGLETLTGKIFEERARQLTVKEVLKALTRAEVRAVGEGLTEAAQGAVQDAVAAGTYDPDRTVLTEEGLRQRVREFVVGQVAANVLAVPTELGSLGGPASANAPAEAAKAPAEAAKAPETPVDAAEELLNRQAREQARTPAPAEPVPGGEIEYAEWETGGGQPGTSERPDNRSTWSAPPIEVSMDAWLEAPQAVDPAVQLVENPPVLVDPDQVSLSADVRQFKEDADPETGVVRGNELQAEEYFYKPTKPIVVWQRQSGQLEVVTGRHRLDLAKRLKAKGLLVDRAAQTAAAQERSRGKVPVQIFREADGYSRQWALILDAEENIRDGQGTIKDFAKYFRATEGQFDRVQADSRGLTSRAAGRAGWSLGRDATEVLWDLWANGQIGTDKAVALAEGAPGNEGIQPAALQRAKTLNADELRFYAQNLARLSPDATLSASQMGLFGKDDAWVLEAERIAKAQQAVIRQARERILAVQGALRRPDKAREMGLAMGDEAEIRAEVGRLEAEIRRVSNPDAETLRQLLGQPPEGAPMEVREEADLFTAVQRMGQAEVVPKQAQQALRRLGKIAQRRPLTPAEHAELEMLERTVGQEFFAWVDAVKQQEMALGQAEAAARQRAELERRRTARLVGDEVAAQPDLFGEAATEKTGADESQFLLFEPGTEYLRARGFDVLQQQGSAEFLNRLYEYRQHRRTAQQLELFRAAAGDLLPAGPDAAGSSAGSGLPPAGAGQPDGGSLGGGLRGREANPVWRIRQQAFARDFVAQEKVDWIGHRVETAADLAARLQVLRNPRFETFRVFFYRQNVLVGVYAVSSRLPNSTAVFAEGDSIRTLQALKAQLGADSYDLAHNHPSGSPEPSAADYNTTQQFDRLMPGLRRHVVTDHLEYRVISRERGTWESWSNFVDGPGTDPILARDFVLGREVSAPEDVLRLPIQQNPEAAVHLVVLDAKSRVRAIAEVMPADVFRLQAQALEQMQGLARSVGGTGVVAVVADEATARQVNVLYAKGAVGDVVYTGPNGPVSRFQRGAVTSGTPGPLRLFDANTEAETLRVQEDSAPVTAPLVWREGTQEVGVELGLMGRVRGIEMPELVAIVRMLTGDVPVVKKLRKSRGLFKATGKGKIVLNWVIFENPLEAAKVLQHEIGHLVGYLPEGTLARGNLLGRLASLRRFMTTTLPKLPDSGRGPLTPKERAAIRRVAQKEVGPRPARDEEADLAAWNQAVAQRYAELIATKIQDENLLTEELVRGELEALSIDWRGDWEATSPTYQAYRRSSAELYADALSVLLNDPAYLKARAPAFWEVFWNYANKKPAVQQALLDTYDQLGHGHKAVLERRQAARLLGYARGEEILERKQAEREAQRADWRGLKDRAMQAHYDRFWPLIKRAHQVERNGGTLAWHEDPRKVFGAHPLADNKIYRMLDRLQRKVVAPLEAADITLEQLGEYMQLNRIVEGDRNKLANPGGETGGSPAQKSTAREGLLLLRAQLGEEKMTLVRDAAARLQDTFFDLTREAVEVGLYNRQVWEEVVVPNRRSYAPFAVLEYLEKSDHIPAGIKAQLGTFQDVANPAWAMVAKAAVLQRAIEYQKTRNLAVTFLQEHFPEEIEAARTKTLPGGKREALEPGDGRTILTRLVDGKPDAYYVDKEITDMFERVDPDSIGVAWRVLNTIWRRGLYPMFVTYNPAFQLAMGPMRDFKRTVVNLPVNPVIDVPASPNMLRRIVTRENAARLAAEYALALGDAWARMRGRITPIMAEMMDNHAIGGPFENFGTALDKDDAFRQMLRQYHVIPDTQKAGWWKRGRWGRAISGMLEGVSFLGQVMEGVPKVAAYRILTRDLGWAPRDAGEWVRNYAGVPPFMRRGRSATLDGALLPFINIATKGYATDLSLATNADTAAGWWLRFLVYGGGIMGILTALAELGLFGEELAERIRGIGSYDKTNYTVIPFGEGATGKSGLPKTGYMRIPRDETARVMAGTLYQATLLAGRQFIDDPNAVTAEAGAIADMWGDSLPGINPVVEIGQAWMTYAAGENPRDAFYDRTILTPDEQRLRGLDSLQPMLVWTLDQTGVTNLYRPNDEFGTVTEGVITNLPIINRLIKFSDYGHIENQQARMRAAERVGAELRKALPEGPRELLQEYGRLRAIGEEFRNPMQQMRYERLRVWNRRVYTRYEEALRERIEADLPMDDLLDGLDVASEVFRDE